MFVNICLSSSHYYHSFSVDYFPFNLPVPGNLGHTLVAFHIGMFCFSHRETADYYGSSGSSRVFTPSFVSEEPTFKAVSRLAMWCNAVDMNFWWYMVNIRNGQRKHRVIEIQTIDLEFPGHLPQASVPQMVILETWPLNDEAPAEFDPDSRWSTGYVSLQILPLFT